LGVKTPKELKEIMCIVEMIDKRILFRVDKGKLIMKLNGISRRCYDRLIHYFRINEYYKNWDLDAGRKDKKVLQKRK